MRPLPGAPFNTAGLWRQGMLIWSKITSFESSKPQCSWNKGLLRYNLQESLEEQGAQWFSEAPLLTAHSHVPLFVPGSSAPRDHLTSLPNPHRPESHAAEFTHAQGQSQARCSWHPEQIHAWRGSTRNVLIFGGLYQACWKPADIPRVCHDASLLQIHLEDSEQCFTAVLWRGRLRLNTLQKCKPLTPQSRQALMLYTIFSYSPWLAFLIFCNVVWLVWIWIIIFFYSFKLRLLGPRNKYVWIVGM